ncbi:MAG: hypothetical protein GKR86_07875, partial [Ilumatobacter sp.]|nr:hypothetical protein [Ilumatobacter sp.]
MSVPGVRVGIDVGGTKALGVVLDASGSVVAEETGDLLATCASSDLRQITLNVRLSLRRSDHKGIQALRVALLTRDNCCCCDADALLPDEREFAAQGIAKVAPDTKQDRQYQLVWSLVRCDGRDDCDDCDELVGRHCR